MTRARRFLVLGAGLSGLSAAFRLTELAPEAHVEVWEASARAGGCARHAHLHSHDCRARPPSPPNGR
ncbi:MAG: NAD(P)-binding protein [Planctomycetes bacterium]|nr:NAD(P)-binding protein [Planctomycetota bacterium]